MISLWFSGAQAIAIKSPRNACPSCSSDGSTILGSQNTIKIVSAMIAKKYKKWDSFLRITKSSFIIWTINIVKPIAIILPIMCLIILAPRPPRESESQLCVKTYEIFGPLHVVINCDSYEFVKLADNPALLLTDERSKLWQSRPLYPVLGYFAAMPFKASGILIQVGMSVIGIKGGMVIEASGKSVNFNSVRYEIDDTAKSVVMAQGKSINFSSMISGYLGYLTINMALLVIALIIFCRLLSNSSQISTWLIFPASLLLVNEVSKAFFWTPHLQIFNILYPILTIGIGCKIIENRTIRLKKILLIGMAIGVACLIYGAFIVTAFSAAGALLIKQESNGKFWRSRVLPASCLLLATIVPILTWIGIVKLFCGSFYSHEIQVHRQFVWIFDAARLGWVNFSTVALANISTFYSMLAAVSIFPLLVLATVRISVSILQPKMLNIPLAQTRNIASAMGCYFCAAIPFYALMGFHATRLVWCLTVPLILLIAIDLRNIEANYKSRVPSLVSIIVTVLYIAFWTMSAGPYS